MRCKQADKPVLESRVIDGRKYLLIPVGATVEINGMETKI